MATALLQPPTASRPLATIQYSQAAPSFLKAQNSWSLPYPLSLLFDSESQAKWQSYENIFLACLRSGDLPNAEKSLADLTKRFGKDNERIRALNGLFQEASATSDKDLAKVLSGYDEILQLDPTIFGIRKRRAALLRTLGRTQEAVGALITILDASPTDAEAWAELADVYFEQGLYEQSIHCWEEVLIIMPNAWNIQARVAEVLYLSASRASGGGEQVQLLGESLRRYCRSVELCDDYLRGYYGLKLVTSRLRDQLDPSRATSNSSSSNSSGQAVPTLAKVEKLNELATKKLAEIVRKSASGDKEWDGYDPAEIDAARQLLDKDTQPR